MGASHSAANDRLSDAAVTAARPGSHIVNQFTSSFMSALAAQVEEGKDVFTSGLNVQLALTMAKLATTAGSEAGEELAQALCHNPDGNTTEDDVVTHLGALTDALAGVDEVTLKIANSIFVSGAIKEEYCARMLEAFSAEAYPLTTADAINEWCAEKTQGMIEEIIAELDPSTVAVLVSAIYFKGNWTSKFDKSMTSSGQFNHMDGATSECQMMFQSFEADANIARVAQTPSYTGLLLPYGASKRFASVFVLPKEEGGAALQACSEEIFSGADFNLEAWHSMGVDVSIPRFTAEFSLDLVKVFKEMGVTRVFASNDLENDWARLREAPGCYVSAILHKAIVKVNEEGAEAAAVTAVVVDDFCCDLDVALSFILDRPFLFAVCDTQTGVILFSGKIVAPQFL